MRTSGYPISNKEEAGSLIAFTTLAPLSVGGLVALLVFRVPQAILSIDQAAAIVFIVGLLALIFSLFHLGRPWRAPLAILHVSTSWMSREVILFSGYLALLFCFTVLPIFNLDPMTISIIGWTGAFAGLASTFATGKTYQLKAQPIWDHWSTIFIFALEALTSGVLFGLFSAHIFVSIVDIEPAYKLILAVLLIISHLTSYLRYVSPSRASPEALSSHNLVLGPFHVHLVMRLTFGFIALVMMWLPGVFLYYAWIPALVGESLDRIIFFNTNIPVTLVSRYTS